MLATLSTTRTENRLAEGAATASALTSGYLLAFVIGAVLVAVAFIIAVTVLERPDRGAEQEAPGSESAFSDAA